MDTQNDRKAASQQALAALARCRIVVGVKQLRKALLSGTADRVFLAKDADPALTEPLAALCQLKCVAYVWVRSMTDLGRACGIEVGAAAAAAVRSDAAGNDR